MVFVQSLSGSVSFSGEYRWFTQFQCESSIQDHLWEKVVSQWVLKLSCFKAETRRSWARSHHLIRVDVDGGGDSSPRGEESTPEGPVLGGEGR